VTFGWPGVSAPVGAAWEREAVDASFALNPNESNRIWILDRPIKRIGGSVGSSRCSSVCGESECRTVEVRGTTFEVIPERLVVRAALIAAAQLLDDEKRA
jgi:hypothetical protein